LGNCRKQLQQSSLLQIPTFATIICGLITATRQVKIVISNRLGTRRGHEPPLPLLMDALGELSRQRKWVRGLVEDRQVRELALE
jgi:hypothetical protein